MKTKTLAVAFLSLMIISSCTHNTVNNSACANVPVIASWKVDGTAYQASLLSGVYSSSSTLTIYACGTAGQVAPMIGMQIPHTIAAGTYDLRGRIEPSSAIGHGGAEYVLYNSSSYFTDNSTNTGTLTVTNVNMVDSTYSATFQFTAQDTVAHTIVHITDGVITSAGF